MKRTIKIARRRRPWTNPIRLEVVERSEWFDNPFRDWGDGCPVPPLDINSNPDASQATSPYSLWPMDDSTR